MRERAVLGVEFTRAAEGCERHAELFLQKGSYSRLIDLCITQL